MKETDFKAPSLVTVEKGQWMFWSGILWSNTRVTPKRLKWGVVGNIPGGKDWFESLLMWVSITCEWGGVLMEKSGAIGGRNLDLKRGVTTVTGHKYRLAMEGIWTTWWDLLSWSFLVDLIIRLAPRVQKMTSCLRKYLLRSNWEVLWGAMFDILRNEYKSQRKKGL